MYEVKLYTKGECFKWSLLEFLRFFTRSKHLRLHIHNLESGESYEYFANIENNRLVICTTCWHVFVLMPSPFLTLPNSERWLMLVYVSIPPQYIPLSEVPIECRTDDIFIEWCRGYLSVYCTKPVVFMESHECKPRIFVEQKSF